MHSCTLHPTFSAVSHRINITVLGNGQYNIGAWQYEDSLIPRLMPDVTILPNGVVVVANGFQVSHSEFMTAGETCSNIGMCCCLRNECVQTTLLQPTVVSGGNNTLNNVENNNHQRQSRPI